MPVRGLAMVVVPDTVIELEKTLRPATVCVPARALLPEAQPAATKPRAKSSPAPEIVFT
jgi:hypothetical protein